MAAPSATWGWPCAACAMSTTMADVNLTNVSISDATMVGMTIDGILVSDLLIAYRAAQRPEPG